AGLPGYNIAGAPGVGVEGDLYPLARVDTGLSNFGFAGSYETSMGAKTQGRDASTFYDTKTSGYRVGARYSIPLSQLLFGLGADLRYYAHTMHARAGDPYIVGGAMDTHVGTSLLLGYRLR